MAFTITSLATKEYNCIGWAAGEDDRWWWPDSAGQYYWPDGIPREETLEAFAAAYNTLNYETCSDGSLEAGFEKVAIFVSPNGKPTHAARQLRDGSWTSKMGANCDIEHTSLDEVNRFGSANYGRVALFMKRST